MEENKSGFLYIVRDNGEISAIKQLCNGETVPIGSGRTNYIRLKIQCAPVVCKINNENGVISLVKVCGNVKVDGKDVNKKIYLKDGSKIVVEGKQFLYKNTQAKNKKEEQKPASNAPNKRHTIVPLLKKRPSLRPTYNMDKDQQKPLTTPLKNQNVDNVKKCFKRQREPSVTPYHKPVKRLKQSKPTRQSPRTPNLNNNSPLFKTPSSIYKSRSSKIIEKSKKKKSLLNLSHETLLSALDDSQNTSDSIRKDLFNVSSNSNRRTRKSSLASTSTPLQRRSIINNENDEQFEFSTENTPMSLIETPSILGNSIEKTIKTSEKKVLVEYGKSPNSGGGFKRSLIINANSTMTWTSLRETTRKEKSTRRSLPNLNKIPSLNNSLNEKINKDLRLLKDNKQEKNSVTRVSKVKPKRKPQKSPKNDLTKVGGLRQVFSPKVGNPPKNDLTNVRGLRKMFSPKPQKSPKNDLTQVGGLRQVFSPKVQNPPKNDLTNVRGLRKMFSPKAQKSPKNDLTQVKRLRQVFSPKVQNPPKNDLTNVKGLRKMFSPKVQKSPKNDLTQVGRLRKVFSPKIQNPPKNDLTQVEGISEIFSPKGQKNTEHNDLSDIDGAEEVRQSKADIINELFGKKQLKTYGRRSYQVSPVKNPVKRLSIGDVPLNNYVSQWVEKHQRVDTTRVETKNTEINDDNKKPPKKQRGRKPKQQNTETVNERPKRTRRNLRKEESEERDDDVDKNTTNEEIQPRTRRGRKNVEKNKTAEKELNETDVQEVRVTRGRKRALIQKQTSPITSPNKSGPELIVILNKSHEIDERKPTRGGKKVNINNDAPKVTPKTIKGQKVNDNKENDSELDDKIKTRRGGRRQAKETSKDEKEEDDEKEKSPIIKSTRTRRGGRQAKENSEDKKEEDEETKKSPPKTRRLRKLMESKDVVYVIENPEKEKTPSPIKNNKQKPRTTRKKMESVSESEEIPKMRTRSRRK